MVLSGGSTESFAPDNQMCYDSMNYRVQSKLIKQTILEGGEGLEPSVQRVSLPNTEEMSYPITGISWGCHVGRPKAPFALSSIAVAHITP